MLIVTIEDQDFPDVLKAADEARLVGSYKKDGKVQLIRANSRLVMITQENITDKIAIKPARNESEAEQIALRLLEREEARGNQIEKAP